MISRTALITLILLAPASARMTLNSVFSSTAAAAAPPPRAAGHGDRRRADAPLRLELLDELGDLDDGHVGEVIDDLFLSNFSHLLAP